MGLIADDSAGPVDALPPFGLLFLSQLEPLGRESSTTDLAKGTATGTVWIHHPGSTRFRTMKVKESSLRIRVRARPLGRGKRARPLRRGKRARTKPYLFEGRDSYRARKNANLRGIMT